MLEKNEQASPKQPREINGREMSIGFTPEVKHLKSTPFRAGQKTREFNGTKMDKDLKKDSIEPSMSEWAVPVLFGPKSGKLLFCVEYMKINAMNVKDM